MTDTASPSANETVPTSGFLRFWTSLPGVLTAVAAVITAVGSIYLASSGGTANAVPPQPTSSAAVPTPALDTTQLDSVRNSTTSADQALINSCAGGDGNSCTLVVTGLQQECSQGLAVSCNVLNVLFG